MSKTSAKHKALAPVRIGFGVLTVSTSRYQKLERGEEAEDPSGDVIVQMLSSSGYEVLYRRIVSDDRQLIVKAVNEILSRRDIDAIIMSGGTGISPTDVTIETIRPLFEKELSGFGELLRKISFEEIGSSAVLTRATAGVIGGRVIFCIPGSPQAVETALKYLIIPEVGHILKHAREI